MKLVEAAVYLDSPEEFSIDLKGTLSYPLRGLNALIDPGPSTRSNIYEHLKAFQRNGSRQEKKLPTDFLLTLKPPVKRVRRIGKLLGTSTRRWLRNLLDPRDDSVDHFLSLVREDVICPTNDKDFFGLPSSFVKFVRILDFDDRITVSMYYQDWTSRDHPDLLHRIMFLRQNLPLLNIVLKGHALQELERAVCTSSV